MSEVDAPRPPAPGCSLRVGIIGHRPHKLADAFPRIENTLCETLSGLNQALLAVSRSYSQFYDAHPPTLRVICSLAAGADILGARAALSLERTRVNLILPFARDEFGKDFDGARKEAGQDEPDWKREFERLLTQAHAVLELENPDNPADRTQRDHAYETAGHLTVEASDILIAVWDGQSSGGRGGTAEIVRHARGQGRPVIRISPDGSETGLLHAARQGSEQDDNSEGERLLEPDAAKLTPLLDRMLAPPVAFTGAGERAAQNTDSERLCRFLGEPWRRRTRMGFYRSFLALFAGRGRPRLTLHFPGLAERRRTDWQEFFHHLGANHPSEDQRSDDTGSSSPAAACLGGIFHSWLWADHLASFWSEHYRSAYVLTFFLAALAVVTGLLSVFWWDLYVVKALCVTLEFGLILLILGLVRAGRRGDWHRRWVDYRRLAEELRAARSMPLLGRSARGPGGGDDTGDKGSSWIIWYIRATLADVDLPSIRITPDYLRGVLDAVSESDVGHPGSTTSDSTGQIGYHEGNAAMLGKLDHRLHKLGEGLFAATGVMVGAYVLCFLGEALVWPLIQHGRPEFDHLKVFKTLKPTVTFFAAAMPTLAAAISGIRAQGDFRSFAEQSRRTASELRRIHPRLQTVRERPTRLAVVRELDHVANASMSDLRTWGLIYSKRELDLPA